MAINARLAGDAVGATKMDRPEWCAVHPTTGEIYFTLTNNSNRSVDPSSSSQLPARQRQPARLHRHEGHVCPAGQPQRPHHAHEGRHFGSAASAFTWDVYLFGAESTAPQPW
jgi:secreted PhoX family phosphatase